MKRSHLALASLVVGLSAACGHVRPAVAPLVEADQTAAAAAARDADAHAKEAFAHAESLRKAAHEARDAGDDTAAALLAERALVAYEHAFVVARAATANGRGAEADARLKALLADREKATTLLQSLEKATRDAEAALADFQAHMQREPVGRAKPEREAARLIEARELLREGRELCGAARLLVPDDSEAAAAESPLPALEKTLEGQPKPVPLDATAHARVACLRALTHARRKLPNRAEGRGANDADALLSQLSGESRWTPSRDERGVVVPIASVIENGKLTSSGTTKLSELGKVAAGRPEFAVQVVIRRREKGPPPPVDAISDTLVQAGVPKARVGVVVVAGTPRAPEPKTAGAAVDVVFVASDG